MVWSNLRVSPTKKDKIVVVVVLPEQFCQEEVRKGYFYKNGFVERFPKNPSQKDVLLDVVILFCSVRLHSRVCILPATSSE